ncbi:MAG: MaoC family dehydratase [Acidobacteriota bacterium]|nr:MAG: MaoC family dehydratase [Acidobacteriota bacterium]
MGYGRYYEEFTVGDIYRHWPGRTITEHDDTWFSLMTMNQHPLHIDAHYAAGTQHGQRLVNGTFIFSLAVGMSVADVSGKCIANLEYEFIRHLGPSFHGDTIYAVTEVLEKRESAGKPDRGIVYVETRAHNQNGEKVLVFRRRVLVPKRPLEGG